MAINIPYFYNKYIGSRAAVLEDQVMQLLPTLDPFAADQLGTALASNTILQDPQFQAITQENVEIAEAQKIYFLTIVPWVLDIVIALGAFLTCQADFSTRHAHAA